MIGDKRKIAMETLDHWSRPIAVAAVLLASVTLLLQLKSNEIAQISVNSSREELADKDEAAVQLEARLGRREAQYRDVISEIAKQVDQEQQLHLTMAEVLSRVKMLQAEQDHFEVVEKDLKGRFATLDSEFMQMSSQNASPSVR